MAEYDISLTKDQVEGLLTNDDGLKGLVTAVVNQVLETQMSEHLSAGHYERSDGRKGYRNGYRPRQLYTRIGKLVLRVPPRAEMGNSVQICSVVISVLSRL